VFVLQQVLSFNQILHNYFLFGVDLAPFI